MPNKKEHGKLGNISLAKFEKKEAATSLVKQTSLIIEVESQSNFPG